MFRQIVKFRQLQTLDVVKSNVDSVSFQGRRKINLSFKCFYVTIC